MSKAKKAALNAKETRSIYRTWRRIMVDRYTKTVLTIIAVLSYGKASQAPPRRENNLS
jgi:hypothetical protein